MKTIFPFRLQWPLVLFLAFCVTLLSCAKEEDDDPEPKRNSNLSVTIDGEHWEAPGVVATTSGYKQMYAQKSSDGTSFQVIFPEDGTGTFDLVDDDVMLSYVDGNDSYSFPISGSIIVDVNTSTSLKGTFHGEITDLFDEDTVIIQNGVFIYER
ncbi:MAG: DUF6252 family protein [Bacteroidia bacterium]